MSKDIGQLILSVTITILTVWLVHKFWEGFFEKRRPAFFALLIIYAIGALIESYVSLGTISTKTESFAVIGIVISKLLLVACIYLLSFFWSRRKAAAIPDTYCFLLFFIPFGSVCITINEFYSKEYSIFSVATICILLLFNIGIYELYVKINKTLISEKERTAYVQQVEMISQSLMAQKKMMEEFHEEKHNLINKIIILKNAMESDDKEAIVKKFNQIITASKTPDAISDSGNSTVDAIINFKYAIAKEYLVDFQLNLFIPEVLPIEDCDLGVVMGNAIDNAIDAAKGCRIREKVIEISMGVKKGSLVMRIKNPYEHELKRDKAGNYLSTKEEKFSHGFGLNSIEKIVNQYEGECLVKTENGFFILTILMNLGEF